MLPLPLPVPPCSPQCCMAVEGAMKALLSFKRFLQELNWPEESFAAFLDQKVAAICADRFQEAAEVYACSCVCVLVLVC